MAGGIERRITASDKRIAFRAGLTQPRLLRFPGAYSPLVARLAAAYGFDGTYLSGAAVSGDLAMPDIGLLTLTEVTDRCRVVAGATDLPTLVDADTGFGEEINVARTIQALEDAGAAGCHLEDQENPKRCGHLDHKVVVPAGTMTRRVAAAVLARTDPAFVICARTDARTVEGLPAAIERARRYVDAGADMIFPEALETPAEFEAFRAAVPVPLVANMTEFGRSPLLSADTLGEIGFDVVIWPVSALRAAMGAVERLFEELAAEGTQARHVPQMQSRSRLYELNSYAEYSQFDASLLDFDTTGHGHDH